MFRVTEASLCRSDVTGASARRDITWDRRSGAEGPLRKCAQEERNGPRKEDRNRHRRRFGIGRACALAYAREGASVVVSDIVESGGRETVELIEKSAPGARAIFVRADASKPEDHEALVDAAIEHFGALHIACNNAGIGGEAEPDLRS